MRAPGSPLARLRQPPVLAAWLAVAAWIGVVWWLGSGSFGMAGTSRYLLPLLRWAFPEAPYPELLAWAADIRNLAHPAVYGVLAALSWNAARLSGAATPLRAAAWALALSVALAVFDELRQSALPDRVGDLGDVGRDVAGIVGVLAALVLLGRIGGPRFEGARDGG